MSKQNIAPLPDQADRERILHDLDRSMLVEAAAGTGKTTAMVGRMTELLATGKCRDIGRLAAVTFTRKAAAELRGRFRFNLEREAAQADGEKRERLEQALAGIDRCSIGTIHSFCARLLRERPVEAGVDLAFQEIEEDQDQLLREEAWSRFTSHLLVKDELNIRSRLGEMGLNLADLAAVFHRFCQYRDVKSWPRPEPRPAAAGSPELFANLQRYVEDMIRMGRDFPRDFGTDQLMPKYKIIPRVIDNFGSIDTTAHLEDLLLRFNARAKPTQYVWAETGVYSEEDAKREEQRWLDFQEQEVKPLLTRLYEDRYGLVMDVLEEAVKVYDQLRAERGVLNFQDLLQKAADLLQYQPHVRAYFARRYTHLLVDEFQDTDPIQAQVMLLLTASDLKQPDWRKCRPRPGSLFVVGDPKQSIYRFRRADIETYQKVKQIIAQGPGKGQEGVIARLTVNFRTVGPLIEWVNRVFEPGEDPPPPPAKGKGKKAKPAAKTALTRFPDQETPESPTYTALDVGRTDQQQGELSGIYRLEIPKDHCANKDLVAEYEPDAIARFILHACTRGLTVPRTRGELDRGKTGRVDFSDFLIITRNTTNLKAYAAKLQEYGVPHQVTGGSALNEIRELHLLRAGLAAVLRPDDPVALVGALRSELFGVSDRALYRYRRAGGTFCHQDPPPAGLSDPETRLIIDAFARLKRYSQWLKVRPALAALERIVADLGLLVMAGTSQGGEVQAGGLAKALELLRQGQAQAWTPGRLLEQLDELAEAVRKHDNISVRADEKPRVRLMNLHQVKGLEAPVVFLADPSGESEHGISLHVDRAEDQVRAYMKIAKPGLHGREGAVIAQPADWASLEKKERAFDRAEQLRLRYVAATRAGAALIVTRKTSRNHTNPWVHFEPHLLDCPALEIPEAVEISKAATFQLKAEEPEEAARQRAGRLAALSAPSHQVLAAKSHALSQPDEDLEVVAVTAVTRGALPGAEGEHGHEWGSAIHLLLQQAMDDPAADLAPLARAALIEYDLDPALAEDAAAVVRAVINSDFWKRARQSERLLTEVPFLAADAEDPKAVVRGVIDLAFREKDGWVLVDYKTDRLRGRPAKSLLAAYSAQLKLYAQAFEQATGDQIKERNLFFIASGEIFRV